MSLTGLAFLAGFAIGIAMCFVRYPVWGLYTYVAVYYLDAPSRWWGADLPDLRWSLLSAGATLLATWIYTKPQRQGWLNQGPFWIFIIYAAWMWLQSIWALTGTDHDYGLSIFSKYIIVLYLVYTLVDTKERALSFLFVHVVGCFYLGLLAYGAYDGGRLDGVGGPGIDDSNSLGMQMGTAALCAAGLYLAFSDWRKWVAGVSLPFILNTVIMTGSRGAFVSLLAGGVAMYVFQPPKQMAKIIPYALAGIALFGYLASGYFWERVATINDAVQEQQEVDHSVATRLELLNKQWEMAKAHPLGAGHKGTTFLSYQYMSEEYMSTEGGRSSHNTLMSSLVDQGFPGLALWLILILLLIKRSLSLRRQFVQNSDVQFGWITASLFGALAVYWTAGMFAPLLKAEIYIWLTAVICAMSQLTASEEGAAQSPLKN